MTCSPDATEPDATTHTDNAPAVLFLIFNRPDKTREVFEAIRQQKPPKLYIAADGPRASHPDDPARCARTREIIQQIDWDCSVKTLLRDHNLGCRDAVVSAINWFFEHEPEGIILEDDCLPHPSFFSFTTALLERYRDDPRVMMISGTRLSAEPSPSPSGYDFTRMPVIWGWATWRRAWSLYDIHMKALPDFLRNDSLRRVSDDVDVRLQWIKCLIATYELTINTWDYQWMFCMMLHDAVGICPSRNMIRNLGMDGDGTHGQHPQLMTVTRDTGPVVISGHPATISIDPAAELEAYRILMNVKQDSIRNPLLRWRKRISRRLKCRRMLRRFLAGSGP